MRKNLEKFGKTLGVLATATEFLVKFLLNTFPLQSGGKFRPKSKISISNKSCVADYMCVAQGEFRSF